jgi:hypothetical protein
MRSTGWKLQRLCCRIQRFPLSPGQYPITLFCRVNGDIADWVQQAALLSVEPGDFFGIGRLPQPTHGGGLVPQNWHVKEGRASQPSKAWRETAYMGLMKLISAGEDFDIR